VYVVETPDVLATAPIDLPAVSAWMARVPTLQVDGQRPAVDVLAVRLGDFWIPGETVVYVGRTGGGLGSRVRGFYQTSLGDSRPHAGGHWLKTLSGLDSFLVWWAETDEPERHERALLEAFAKRARSSASGLAAELVLPFANRENADHARKPHGISRATLPRPRARAGRAAVARGAVPGIAAGTDRADWFAGINVALQTMACASRDRQVAAVDAARELDRQDLLRDRPDRRGLPLRNLLRKGRIDHAYQEAGRWWFIRCGSGEGRPRGGSPSPGVLRPAAASDDAG
jgi:hypothetical protein